MIAGPALEVGQPLDGAPAHEDHVEQAVAEVRVGVVEVGADELGAAGQADFVGQAPRQRDRLVAEVQTDDLGAEARPAQRVEAEVALQVQQRRALAHERSELLALERPQRRRAGLEALDVVERALLVDLGPVVPELEVGGPGLRRDGIAGAAARRAHVRGQPLQGPVAALVETQRESSRAHGALALRALRGVRSEVDLPPAERAEEYHGSRRVFDGPDGAAQAVAVARLAARELLEQLRELVVLRLVGEVAVDRDGLVLEVVVGAQGGHVGGVAAAAVAAGASGCRPAPAGGRRAAARGPAWRARPRPGPRRARAARPRGGHGARPRCGAATPSRSRGAGRTRRRGARCTSPPPHAPAGAPPGRWRCRVRRSDRAVDWPAHAQSGTR